MVFNHNEYMMKYRQTHLKYYERENERNKEKLRNKYKNDDDYRERKKNTSKENYYKRKAILN